MPSYWGEGDPGWDEEEDGERTYRPPKASQFHYSLPFHVLPPPESISHHESVQFSDRIPQPPTFLPPQTASVPRGLLGLLLGHRARPASAPEPRLTLEQQQEASAYRGQHVLALIVSALREIGVRRVYCRYDGGGDEGFAWLDHAETQSGERLAPTLLARRLGKTSLLRRGIDAGLWPRRRVMRAQQLRDIADMQFADECAARLLGGGFGTGEMLLYGALTVDLDTCTIADDRDASPVTRHFTIEA
jgi:hypothetical protein